MKNSRFTRSIHCMVMLGLLVPTTLAFGQPTVRQRTIERVKKIAHGANEGSKRALASTASAFKSGREATVKRLKSEYKLVISGFKAALKRMKGKTLSPEEKKDVTGLAARTGAVIALILAVTGISMAAIKLEKHIRPVPRLGPRAVPPGPIVVPPGPVVVPERPGPIVVPPGPVVVPERPGPIVVPLGPVVVPERRGPIVVPPAEEAAKQLEEKVDVERTAKIKEEEAKRKEQKQRLAGRPLPQIPDVTIRNVPPGESAIVAQPQPGTPEAILAATQIRAEEEEEKKEVRPTTPEEEEEWEKQVSALGKSAYGKPGDQGALQAKFETGIGTQLAPLAPGQQTAPAGTGLGASRLEVFKQKFSGAQPEEGEEGEEEEGLLESWENQD